MSKFQKAIKNSEQTFFLTLTFFTHKNTTKLCSSKLNMEFKIMEKQAIPMWDDIFGKAKNSFGNLQARF